VEDGKGGEVAEGWEAGLCRGQKNGGRRGPRGGVEVRKTGDRKGVGSCRGVGGLGG